MLLKQKNGFLQNIFTDIQYVIIQFIVKLTSVVALVQYIWQSMDCPGYAKNNYICTRVS